MGKRIGNLNLVNYKDHPTNDNYKILNFNTLDEADLFEKLLKEQSLWYEKDVEIHKEEPLYLFAIRNKDFDKVQRLNFEVSAQFRSPMIKNKIARYVLVGFFIFLITIALIGYFKSRV